MIPLQAKLAALLLALAGAFWWGHHWEAMSCRAATEALRASQATELAQAYEAQAAEALRRKNAYEQEIDLLNRQRAAVPDMAVRLCQPAAHPGVPQARSPGPQRPAPSRILPPPPEPAPDIGPGLYSDADLADSIVAKCRAD